MKVKFFRGFDFKAGFGDHTVYPLEDLINEFIKDKQVIDIKYQAKTAFNPSEPVEMVALVMYEED